MLAKFFKNRLKEASTYRGIIVLLGIFGVSIDPSKGDAIVAACLAIYGVLLAFLPDVFGEKKEPETITPAELAKEIASGAEVRIVTGDALRQPDPPPVRKDSKISGQML